MLKVVFRADASIEIGTGHIMRCLTLADLLSENGCDCCFITRDHKGSLISHIEEKGYRVYVLPARNVIPDDISQTKLFHANWLGASQETDASECELILQDINPNWVVVDHYAIDHLWEKRIQSYCNNIMVIDDLADRKHSCRILLDQTFKRKDFDYKWLVPDYCKVMCGAQYSILRPDFSAWRDYSLSRRNESQFRKLLINLGGVDKDNLTTKILKTLQNMVLSNDLEITVVMGKTAPWVNEVKRQSEIMRHHTVVKVGVGNMAEIMSEHDLAIGAVGATSWERCSLGLPTIMLALAENQKEAALSLSKAKAGFSISLEDCLSSDLQETLNTIIHSEHILREISINCRKISDGKGAIKVVREMLNIKL